MSALASINYAPHQLAGYLPQAGDEHLKNCILNTLSSVENFLQGMERFVWQGHNPNIRMGKICVGEDVFHDLTCFHLVYLYWKWPGAAWSEATDSRFRTIIDGMLNDGRIDLEASFTWHRKSNIDELDHHKEWVCQGGLFLERLTIAHYASLIKDPDMVEDALQKNPRLLKSTCCITKVIAKLSLVCLDESPAPIQLRADDFTDLLGTLDDPSLFHSQRMALSRDNTHTLYTFNRIKNVTLLHLAAKVTSESVCRFLAGRGADRISLDSEGRNPYAYVTNSKHSFNWLQHRDSLNRQPSLPQTELILHKEGYTLVWDTIKKVPKYTHERLTKASLIPNASREGLQFKRDLEIPVGNRSENNDYTNSGFQRGHQAAAGNATFSIPAMLDTFLYSNVAPQCSKLNQGKWKTYENRIRTLVNSSEVVEVFTGPMFLATQWADGKKRVSYEVIGPNEVAVPTHFF